ncbi:MAG: hypothetical protein QMD46_12700 [Methanomicrobiales archaeon]|nr:hypothetical protein [Methanomicrobiales archaeon]
MQEFGCGFVPLYADYAQMIDCTVEALDEYGRWLGEQVRAWKPSESIEDLRDLLAEVREVLGARNRISGVGLGEDWYGIDMSYLPSIEIPEGIDTSYPVWAMSSDGGMLTGECADCVETILDVIQTQNPDLDEDDLVQREDLPEPVRTWYVEHNTIAPDDGRYVWETGDEDEEPKIRWGDVLKEYGFQVWGITF